MFWCSRYCEKHNTYRKSWQKCPECEGEREMAMTVNSECWTTGCVGTMKVTYDFGCGESTPERVKRLEKEREATDKALAEAKAKLAAEEAAKRTYGEKVAEGLIRPCGTTHLVTIGPFPNGYDVRPLQGQAIFISEKRKDLAIALDKAYADGAKEQREKCREAVADYGDSFKNPGPNNVYGKACNDMIAAVDVVLAGS